MDPLSELLSSFDLHARICVNTQFCGQWTYEHKDTGITSFHIVSHGQCWFHQPHQASMELHAGDMVLLPKDRDYVLSSYRQPPPSAPPPRQVDFNRGLQPDSVGVLCGDLLFRHATTHPLLDELPKVLVLSEGAEIKQWSTPLCQMLRLEQVAQSTGSQLIINKLAEVLFVQCLRYHLQSQPNPSGWLAALQDPGLYRALHAIHLHPEYKWTLASLAQQAGMSRTVFAERFREQLKQSPFHYLDWWRMQKAWEYLTDGQETVYATALKVGYSSESAFSKAFKRHFGRGPGEVRKAHMP